MKIKKRFLAFLLTLVMLLTFVQPVLAAEADEAGSTSPYQFYVPIGTSITGGFGNGQGNGWGSAISGSFGQKYPGQNVGVFAKLVADYFGIPEEGRYDGALLGTRAYEFRVLLEDDLHGDDFTEGWSQVKCGNGEEHLKEISAEYKENLAKADLITIELGANEMMSFVIYQMQGFLEDLSAETEDTHDDSLLRAWIRDYAESNQNEQLLALLAIADEIDVYKDAIEFILTNLTQSMLQFQLKDFNAVLDDIYDINHNDPDIYVISTYNPVRNLLMNPVQDNTTGASEVKEIVFSTGEMLQLSEEQIVDFVETIANPVIDAQNNFLRSGSKYACKYTYVDITNVDLSGSVDGTHPSNAGHAYIAEHIITAINRNLVKRGEIECQHNHKTTVGAIKPTLLTLGWTGTVFCADCGHIIETSKIITYRQYVNQASSGDVTDDPSSGIPDVDPWEDIDEPDDPDEPGTDPSFPDVDYSVLAFSSDIHNQTDNISVNRFKNWIEVTQQLEGKFDFIGLCGDNANGTGAASGDAYWSLVAPVFDVLDASGIPYAVTTGNHEVQHGQYPNSTNATAQKISRMEAVEPDGANYHIYTFGALITSSNSYYEITEEDTAALAAYIETVPEDQPIFILSHYPLHNSGGRTIVGIQPVITLLNNHPNCIFVWGHNHTNANNQEKHYDKIFTDDIDGNPINFTYCAAGCMSDSEYSSGSNSVKGKGLIATVTEDASYPTVMLTYVDANGKSIISPVVVDLKGGEMPAAFVATELEGEYSFVKVDAPQAGGEYLIVDRATGKAVNLTYCPGYTNNNSYTYSGFSGKVVTIDDDKVIGGVYDDMVWKFTKSGSGFSIKNSATGSSLNATYTGSNPSAGALLCNKTSDVWTLNGSILKSANANKNFAYDTEDTISPKPYTGVADFFTVRSTGTNVDFYQVSEPTDEPEVTFKALEGEYAYVEVARADLQAGHQYVIVSDDTDHGTVKAINLTESVGYVNGTNYVYNGFEGAVVTIAESKLTGGVTEDMVWKLEDAGSGAFNIKNVVTGTYLSSSYGGSPTTGTLKVGDVKTKWSWDSSKNGWKASDSGKYLTIENSGDVSSGHHASSPGNENFFSIRSSANDKIRFYEVTGNPVKEVKTIGNLELDTAVAEGYNYIIVVDGKAVVPDGDRALESADKTVSGYLFTDMVWTLGADGKLTNVTDNSKTLDKIPDGAKCYAVLDTTGFLKPGQSIPENFTLSAAPQAGRKYVLYASGFGLDDNDIGEANGYLNTDNYGYTGIEGKSLVYARGTLTNSEAVTKDMVWEFQAADNGGFYIKNVVTGKYLNSEYKGSNGTSYITLRDTKEVWNYENGKLHSATSDKYLTYDTTDISKMKTGVSGFFTIRSEGNANTLMFFEISDISTIPETYTAPAPAQLAKVDAPFDGASFVFATNGKALGTVPSSGYTLASNDQSFSGLYGKSVNSNLSNVTKNMVWTFEQSGARSTMFNIKNAYTGEYLTVVQEGSSTALKLVADKSEADVWVYSNNMLIDVANHVALTYVTKSNVTEGIIGTLNFFAATGEGSVFKFFYVDPTLVADPEFSAADELGECEQFKLAPVSAGVFNILINNKAVGVKNGALVTADVDSSNIASINDDNAYKWYVASTGNDGEWSIRNRESGLYLSIYVNSKLLSYTASASLSTQPFAWNFDQGFKATISVKKLFGMKSTATYFLTCSGDSVSLANKSVANKAQIFKYVIGNHTLSQTLENGGAVVCGQAGTVVYTCTTCGKTCTHTFESIPHNYVAEVVKPTCSADGKVIYTCSGCGDTIETAGEKALGHHVDLDNNGKCDYCNAPAFTVTATVTQNVSSRQLLLYKYTVTSYDVDISFDPSVSVIRLQYALGDSILWLDVLGNDFTKLNSLGDFRLRVTLSDGSHSIWQYNFNEGTTTLIDW